jgi:cell division protein FtsZ
VAASGAPVPTSSPPGTLREEVATLVPGRAGTRHQSGEHRVPATIRSAGSPREASLSTDADQYDIPTFLRRQGGLEQP